jgi:hypothetical protein
MPKKDLQDPWGLLADLFRELSVPLKIGLFLGLAGGLWLGLSLAGEAAGDGVRVVVARFFTLLTLGLVIVGGTVGVAAGALLDFLRGRLRGRPDRDQGQRRPRRRT